MVVQRVFTNAGTIEEEASLDIDLPVEAVATGLRIKSGDIWFSGDLMDREAAEKLYIELTGRGIFEPKDPALLFWERLGVLHLQVFPIAPGKSSTVEYTLTVPTEYVGGQYHVSYPQKTNANNLAEPSFRFVGEDKAGIKAFIDESEIALGTYSKIAPAPTAAMALKPRTQEVEKITDNVTRVTSKLKVSKKGTLTKATASLNIKHTFRGDLSVVIISPSGKEQTLFNQEGGSENDLVASYPLDDLKDEEVNGEWRLVMEDHAAVDVGTLKSWKLELELSTGEKKTFTAKDTPLFIPDVARSDWDGESGDDWLSAGYTRLSTSAPKIDTLIGRMGKVAIEKEKNKSLYRIELDTAAQLRPLPKKLSVVFLIDASYSVEEGGVTPQLFVATSFLSHVPDASAEIIVYRRFAERVFGQFTDAPQFEKNIKKAEQAGKFSLGNGSAVEEGVKLASSLLKDRANNPTMIVILTDTMLRSRFTNKLALDAMSTLPKNTIVHIVYREESSDNLVDIRDDSAPLAPIAAAHGGVYIEIKGESEAPAELDPISLGLVRPIRLDQCKVAFPNAVSSDFWKVPAAFYEGEGLRAMSITEQAPESMIITGKLWQEEVRHEFKVSQEFSKITAAFAFSGDLYASLSEPQQRALAFYGGAVSPVTSYLAIEPGVRPSRAGIERSGVGFGSGSGSGLLGGRAGSHGIGITWSKDIAALAKKNTDLCFAKYPKAEGWSATIEVESNYQEVIDVLSTKNDVLSACIVEAIWAIQLSPGFKNKTETFNLSY
jgi:subtilisin-like proprotein convertase family protein